MKGSIEKAAEKLGVNKVTIYSYLDEVRGKLRMKAITLESKLPNAGHYVPGHDLGPNALYLRPAPGPP